MAALTQQPTADTHAPTRSGRYVELDGLRGIAVLLVLLYHYTYLFDVYLPGHEPLPVRIELGHYGVQLFFMISGFVILWTARRMPRPRGFLTARLTRLYPPYWVALRLTLLLGWATRISGLYVDPLTAVMNFTMVQRLLRFRSVDGAYWSLSVELLFYGLVFALLVWKRELTDLTARRLIIGWLGVSTIVAIAYRAFPSGITEALVIATAAQFAALFGVGMLAFMGRSSPVPWGLVASTIAVGGLNCWLISGAEDALVNVVLMLAFLLLTLSGQVQALRWRPLVFVGTISYPLYLLHQNLGYALMEIVTPWLGRPAATAIATTTAVGLAWLLHISVEKRISPRLRRALSTAPAPHPGKAVSQ